MTQAYDDPSRPSKEVNKESPRDRSEFALEEYKAVKEEGLVAIQNQQLVLRVGTVGVAGLLGAGLNFWNNEMFSRVIFLLLTPVFCYFILFIWLGEIERMTRVGAYIYNLEHKINEQLVGPIRLGWEHWLRRSHRHMYINYIAVLLLFSFSALTSVVLGIIHSLDSLSRASFWVIGVLHFILLVGGATTLFKAYKRISGMGTIEFHE